MVQQTGGALTAAATEAVLTLLELQNPPMPPAVRLGAARAVLEIGVKLCEAAELDERSPSWNAAPRHNHRAHTAPDRGGRYALGP
jgi:hypothetical protein